MILIEETTLDQVPMPVDQFQEHLRLGTGFSTDTLQVPMLEGFLAASVAAIEGRTGCVLLERDFRWTVNDWTNGEVEPLPVAPVNEILSSSLTDANGVQTVIDPAQFVLRQDSARPSLAARGLTLPTIPTHGSADIRFRAGMRPSFEALPKDLAQAVMLLAAFFYDNRTTTDLSAGAIPFGVSALVERYRNVRLYAGRAS